MYPGTLAAMLYSFLGGGDSKSVFGLDIISLCTPCLYFRGNFLSFTVNVARQADQTSHIFPTVATSQTILDPDTENTMESPKPYIIQYDAVDYSDY